MTKAERFEKKKAESLAYCEKEGICKSCRSPELHTDGYCWNCATILGAIAEEEGD